MADPMVRLTFLRCRTLVSNVNGDFLDLREGIVDFGEVGAA
jgi:hypothetical protein